MYKLWTTLYTLKQTILCINPWTESAPISSYQFVIVNRQTHPRFYDHYGFAKYINDLDWVKKNSSNFKANVLDLPITRHRSLVCTKTSLNFIASVFLISILLGYTGQERIKGVWRLCMARDDDSWEKRVATLAMIYRLLPSSLSTC